ncbi:MAG: hypothetical protein R3F09_15315 [Burkholderiaceae bacterium]
MSKDSVPGGLLSKVVKFVKNPTTNWADLDRPEDNAVDEASRQALKEMIERKRRNDFVRNREFDMLRKVRRREALSAQEGAASPSFYPSSQPANTGERAATIEKIDQIEAQMAGSWFKPKPGDAVGAPTAAMTRPLSEDAAPPPGMAGASADSYAPTLPADLVYGQGAAGTTVAAPYPSAEGAGFAFAPTEAAAMPGAVAPDPATMDTVPPMLPDLPPAAGLPEPDDVLTAENLDPELEEAAIRFANGDTEGAEASLLALLGDQGTRGEHVDTWLALFDLYRASGQQAKFDEAAFDFASRFGRSAPQWSLGPDAGQASGPVSLAPVQAPAPGEAVRMHWTCPSVLGLQSVAALNASLQRNPAPWHVDWRNLKSVEDVALPALVEALRRWGNTRGKYGLRGADHLLQLLTEHSPTDDRSVDPQWWSARLALLRMMNELDEFELVALNYCVTYEVSPPSWEDPLNQFVRLDDAGVTLPPPQDDMAQQVGQGFAPTDVAPPVPRLEAENGRVKGVLVGVITDDVEKALKPVSVATDGAASVQLIELNCRQLERMDFGAAGALLNWVTMQKALKREVSLRQVNRLVGAFFGVIGIHEAARVVVRKD